MPILTSTRKFKPLWFEWEKKSNRDGLRHTFYCLNGNKYIGEWQNNKYHGCGRIELNSGVKYDGKWKHGRRDGYGIISKPHNKGYRCVYTGNWMDDKRNGYGEQWYSISSHYEGEWVDGKRQGWGRMIYPDECIYEGEWHNDMRHGQGIFRKPNRDRYEGGWKNDLKHGPGRYFYVHVGQFYDGVWLKGQPCAGEMLDAGREIAVRPPKYLIPPLYILYPDKIIRKAKRELMQRPEYFE